MSVSVSAQEEGFWSVREFARICRVSEKTVYRWIEKGRIPFQQPGGRNGAIRIPKDALREITGSSIPGVVQVQVIEPQPNSQRPSVRLPGRQPQWR